MKLTNTYDKDAYGQRFADFRKALVTAETTVDNAATLFGRETLNAVLSDALTLADVATLAYAVFKPVSAKGKACEPSLDGDTFKSVSSLRSAKGGDSARKTLDALRDIVNLTKGKADSEGANMVHPTVEAFCNGESGAPKTLRLLQGVLREAMKAETARKVSLVQDNDDTQNPSDNGDANDNTQNNAPAPASLKEHVESLHLAWMEATPEQRAEAYAAIEALIREVNNSTIEGYADSVAEAANS